MARPRADDAVAGDPLPALERNHRIPRLLAEDAVDRAALEVAERDQPALQRCDGTTMVSVTQFARELQRRRRAAAIGGAQRDCGGRDEKPSQEDACCDEPAELPVDAERRLELGTARGPLVTSASSQWLCPHDLAGSATSFFFLRDAINDLELLFAKTGGLMTQGAEICLGGGRTLRLASVVRGFTPNVAKNVMETKKPLSSTSGAFRRGKARAAWEGVFRMVERSYLSPGSLNAVPVWPGCGLGRADPMVYEVIVLDPPEGGRFELECSEPLEEGEHFVRPDVQPLRSYRALHVLPETDDYDGVVEAEQLGGLSPDLGQLAASNATAPTSSTRDSIVPPYSQRRRNKTGPSPEPS